MSDAIPKSATDAAQAAAKAVEANERTVASAEELSFSPNYIADVMKRFSASVKDGGDAPTIRKRRVTIIIPPEACRLDTHRVPFRLTLEELDTAEQESATDDFDVKGGPLKLGNHLVKLSIKEVNGRRLAPHEVDFIWSTLSSATQQDVAEIYQEHCTGFDAKVAKNIKASVEIG